MTIKNILLCRNMPFVSAKIKSIILDGKLTDEERELLNTPIDDITVNTIVKLQKMFRKKHAVGRVTIDHITNMLQCALKVVNKGAKLNNDHNQNLDDLFYLRRAVDILSRYEDESISYAIDIIEKVAGKISLDRTK